MAELELTRSPEDRRLYVLAGVGTLRFEGWLARAATAEADGRSWQLARRGFLRPVIQASDAAGTVVGEFVPRRARRGGTLRWSGRELDVRASSAWRERYAIVDGGGELATIGAKGWGKRPLKVALGDAATPEGGLLLFACFVVKSLSDDAASTTAAATG
jgi:hypothetical protein